MYRKHYETFYFATQSENKVLFSKEKLKIFTYITRLSYLYNKKNLRNFYYIKNLIKPIKINKIPDKKFQNLSETELDIIIFFPKKIPILINSS